MLKYRKLWFRKSNTNIIFYTEYTENKTLMSSLPLYVITQMHQRCFVHKFRAALYVKRCRQFYGRIQSLYKCEGRVSEYLCFNLFLRILVVYRRQSCIYEFLSTESYSEMCGDRAVRQHLTY